MKTSPLVRQQIVCVTIEYRNRKRENVKMYLFKRAIGEPALNAQGELLYPWCLARNPIARMIRYFHGVKRFTKQTLNATVEDYYTQMLEELAKELEQDKYWNYRGDYHTRRLYKRICEVLQEICIEDISVEIPELVTYFYNFAKPI